MVQLRELGLTFERSGQSLQDAAIITTAGFLIITALGYLIGFKTLQVNSNWIVFYVLISVPLQELIFRGFLQKQLFRFGKATAIIIFAALYGAIHFHNALLVALTIAAGIAWGYSFSRRQTLVGPIASHVVLGTYLFLFVL